MDMTMHLRYDYTLLIRLYTLDISVHFGHDRTPWI